MFEEFDLPGLTTVDGIAEVEGNYPSKGGVGERGAWFRDSEGNLLGIGQPTGRPSLPDAVVAVRGVFAARIRDPRIAVRMVAIAGLANFPARNGDEEAGRIAAELHRAALAFRSATQNRHSALMPASLISGCHLSISAFW